MDSSIHHHYLSTGTPSHPHPQHTHTFRAKLHPGLDGPGEMDGGCNGIPMLNTPPSVFCHLGWAHYSQPDRPEGNHIGLFQESPPTPPHPTPPQNWNHYYWASASGRYRERNVLRLTYRMFTVRHAGCSRCTFPRWHSKRGVCCRWQRKPLQNLKGNWRAKALQPDSRLTVSIVFVDSVRLSQQDYSLKQ